MTVLIHLCCTWVRTRCRCQSHCTCGIEGPLHDHILWKWVRAWSHKHFLLARKIDLRWLNGSKRTRLFPCSHSNHQSLHCRPIKCMKVNFSSQLFHTLLLVGARKKVVINVNKKKQRINALEQNLHLQSLQYNMIHSTMIWNENNWHKFNIFTWSKRVRWRCGF
jgi:hypothetical protein